MGPIRTPARGSRESVVRTYAARDRETAEQSYTDERLAARERGWLPVSRFWRSQGSDQVLTVVYGLTWDDVSVAALAAVPPVELAGAALADVEAASSFDFEAASSFDFEAAGRRPKIEGTARHWTVAATGSVLSRSVPSPNGSAPVPWDEERARRRDASRRQVTTLDIHCAGEPLRLIRTGFPEVPQAPILERRRWAIEHADDVRRMVMHEPRGHRDMYGAVLLPPARPDADIAVLFMHNEGFSTMCGHGIIALTHGLIEEGLYPAAQPTTTIRWETPAGLVTATAEVRAGADGEPIVRAVRFVNVPAYLHADRIVVRPRGVRLTGAAAQRRALTVHLAFGGAYYGIVDASDVGLRVVPEQASALRDVGAAITEELRRDHAPSHPLDPSLGFVYGTIIVDGDPATSPDGRARDATIRNVTVFADAEVDRSPCGSGTSALLAARHAAGASDIGDELVNAGITGEAFLARVEGTTRIGEHAGVITSVQGRAFVTGRHTFIRDERDPLADGFLLA
jgi:proline racemase